MGGLLGGHLLGHSGFANHGGDQSAEEEVKSLEWEGGELERRRRGVGEKEGRK